MDFFAYLIGLNIACFLPFYFINYRTQPNPFEFLIANRHTFRSLVKTLYTKYPFSDPFRVNFDYTFVVLIAAALQADSNWMSLFAAVIWTIGIVDFAYSSMMHIIFRRRPSLRSDWLLAKSGLSIVHDNRWLYIMGIAIVLLALLLASYHATGFLLRHSPANKYVSLAIAICLLLPALYHWRMMKYPFFLFRTVYSPTLNFYRNTRYSQIYESIHALERPHFEALNDFDNVVLKAKPDFITVCVESYGSFAFRNDTIHDAVKDVLDKYTRDLADAGLHVASTFSEPPLFAGGSWLSYVSFTYGLRIDDLLLHDALFERNNAFSAYESLFHVLKRNGYDSLLLCPLGGYETARVNWESINKCFQSDKNYDFDSLKFEGQTYSFMAQGNAVCPPDQYSLSFAYDDIVRSRESPFSLFFCTLNSHYPWNSPTQSVDDWRNLDEQNVNPATTTDQESDLLAKYKAAIRYQLDYLLRFALEHASDNLVITLFGDHQAPFVTPESFGKETPVHVISRSRTLTDELCRNGLVPGLDLAGNQAVGIKHEGFLSLFMRAVNQAFGQDRELQIEVRESGADLFGGSEDEHSG